MIDVWASAALVGGAEMLRSTFLAGRGLHDWLVPGAVWRMASAGAHLTFDDGPDPERTPLVLDLLARFGIRATFFVIGERAARAPQLVRRIAAEGHTLGNHSWDHPSMIGLSRIEIRQQLSRCQGVIGSILGTTPSWVRPPYGRRDYRFYQESKRLGLVPMLWSVDSWDWLGIGSTSVARRLRRARPGDIVLLHDGNRRARGLLGGLMTTLERDAARYAAFEVPR